MAIQAGGGGEVGQFSTLSGLTLHLLLVLTSARLSQRSMSAKFSTLSERSTLAAGL